MNTVLCMSESVYSALYGTIHKGMQDILQGFIKRGKLRRCEVPPRDKWDMCPKGVYID